MKTRIYAAPAVKGLRHRVCWDPSKHRTLTQCCFNAASHLAGASLKHLWVNIGIVGYLPSELTYESDFFIVTL